jgi:serine/threonine protein kinase
MEDGTVKIADFGLARVVGSGDERLLGAGGTPAFQAPEVCAGEGYQGQAADVWALGATVYMIRFGRPPFVADGVLQLYSKVITDPVTFPTDVALCAGLRRLLEGMLQKDPAQRWTVAQIVADPWLQQEWEEQGEGEPPQASAPMSTAVGSPRRSVVYPPITVSPAEILGSIAPIRPPTAAVGTVTAASAAPLSP